MFRQLHCRTLLGWSEQTWLVVAAVVSAGVQEMAHHPQGYQASELVCLEAVEVEMVSQRQTSAQEVRAWTAEAATGLLRSWPL